jgi:hypothetical protein
MSWNEAMGKVNSQLEKAKEFRYFALLSTFIFFLDFCLVVFHKSHISILSYASMANDYNIGQIILFFALFTFFMSFVVPLVKYLLIFSSALLPYTVISFFSNESRERIDPNDYFYLSQLERYAIKNNNAIAYEYYKSLTSEKEKENQLNYFCLSLTISICLNCYAYFQNEKAIF